MDVRGESIGSCNRVVGEIDRDELRSSRSSIWHDRCLGFVDRRSASVEFPEGVVWCDVESLDRDEGCLVIAAKLNTIRRSVETALWNIKFER